MSSKYADIICSKEAGSSFCSSGVSVTMPNFVSPSYPRLCQDEFISTVMVQPVLVSGQGGEWTLDHQHHCQRQGHGTLCNLSFS